MDLFLNLFFILFILRRCNISFLGVDLALFDCQLKLQIVFQETVTLFPENLKLLFLSLDGLTHPPDLHLQLFIFRLKCSFFLHHIDFLQTTSFSLQHLNLLLHHFHLLDQVIVVSLYPVQSSYLVILLTIDHSQQLFQLLDPLLVALVLLLSILR